MTPLRPPPPLVSIVLPTFNRAGILPRAIHSVLSQSFRDFELIVVDDGSRDDTRQVVAALRDPRLRYVARDRNGGVAAARNTGVHAATGRLLAFQDSDDEWLPRKLERQVEHLHPVDDRTMSVCGLVRKGLDSRRREVWLLTYPRAPGDWADGLGWPGVLTAGVAYTQTWLVPRQALVDAGGFDEHLCIWDDWDLLIRLSKRLAIRTLPDHLVISQRGSDSLSDDPGRFARDLPLILHKYADDLTQRPNDEAALHRMHALWLYKARQPGRARAALWRSLRRQPLHIPAWRLLARTLLRPVP